MRQYRIGVDIGGTFTDVIVLGGEAGRFDQMIVGKTLTTPADPSVGAIRGIRQALESMHVAPSEVGEIVHGTTLVANAIIERKGMRTGLLVTDGFIDVLDTTELRYDVYDLFLERPAPLVPRSLRREVNERVTSDGTVLVAPDLDEVRRAVQDLVNDGVTSIAVCFLHSYENPAHEIAVRELFEAEFPETWVSVSSDVLPEIREYNRMSTTTANAYVKPLMDNYLAQMEDSLTDLDFDGALHLMLSSGGITSPEAARQYPIRLIESGPAAGTIAATFIGTLAEYPDVISFDMGGTTAKMCVVDDAEPPKSNEFEAARLHRFKVGSGLMIQTPVVHLLEIGAGGGSIARIDEMGLLKVGPESSSADPGPACYDQEGTRPTVTDADVVLGYLNPDWFLGGEMPLNVEAAREAIRHHVAEPLGIGVVEAAAGISEVANHNMATATRVHIAERGRDPRNYAMVAFGGAGPVHGGRIAELLGVPRIIYPMASGALSAFGLLLAPTSFEFSHTFVQQVDDLDWQRARSLFDEMETEGREILSNLGITPAEIHVERGAEMRYTGQGFSVPVTFSNGAWDTESGDDIRDTFYESYRARYSRAPMNSPVQIVNLRMTVAGPTPDVNLMLSEGRRRVDAEVVKGARSIYVPSTKAFTEATVLNWYALESGATYAGPAVVEARESTAVVMPGATITVDPHMNLIVDLPAH